jgi:hypothetical protein
MNTRKSPLKVIHVKSFVTELSTDAQLKMKGGASDICQTQFPLCVNTTFTQVTCILC